VKLGEIAYRRFKEELLGRRLRPGQLVSQRKRSISPA
jgi:DNA-binding GntR family transcriptional regulator